MSDVAYEDVIKLARKLSQVDQMRLIDELVEEQTSPTNDHDFNEDVQPTWTAEELAELTLIEPLAGKEIVALGLTGGWADLGITDSVAWLKRRKDERRRKNSW